MIRRKRLVDTLAIEPAGVMLSMRCKYLFVPIAAWLGLMFCNRAAGNDEFTAGKDTRGRTSAEMPGLSGMLSARSRQDIRARIDTLRNAVAGQSSRSEWEAFLNA